MASARLGRCFGFFAVSKGQHRGTAALLSVHQGTGDTPDGHTGVLGGSNGGWVQDTATSLSTEEMQWLVVVEA